MKILLFAFALATFAACNDQTPSTPPPKKADTVVVDTTLQVDTTVTTKEVK